jgi:hypothetical protein
MEDDMKAKDIDGCENCPLLDNHCSGGMKSDSRGMPIEPPCCSWSPDDEISEEDLDMKVEAQIEDEEEQRQFEEKLRLKKEEKNEKARQSRIHVYSETQQINKLKRKYRGLARLKSFGSALSITNKIMRMPKDSKVERAKTIIDLEMEVILSDIEKIKIIKKQKLKELRRNRTNHA